MSELIDDFIKNEINFETKSLHEGKWYIAKPLNYSKGFVRFSDRLKDAYLVFNCKARAFHYKEDT